jgi:membrane protein
VVHAFRCALENHVPNLAQAIAFNAFLAIPSGLLIGLGLFSVLASPGTVNSLMPHLASVMPRSAVHLLSQSLTRTTRGGSGGITMIAVGAGLALWSLTGAMQTAMWAMNAAYGREETRGFLKRRLIALAMVACVVLASTAVLTMLVLGPQLSGWIGAAAGHPTLVSWLWWTLQWPVLIACMLAAFAVVLRLGPDIHPRRWTFVSPGAMLAVPLWLAASAAFSLYTSRFGSYNKTWGSLGAVIVMLTWLWLSALALLLGAEVNAEAERRVAAMERPGEVVS